MRYLLVLALIVLAVGSKHRSLKDRAKRDFTVDFDDYDELNSLVSDFDELDSTSSEQTTDDLLNIAKEDFTKTYSPYYCGWKNTVDDIDTLLPHKRRSLEQCLYWLLSDYEYVINYDAEDPLSELPPLKENPDTRITISVYKPKINVLDVEEYWNDMHVEGEMKISWEDPRLTWSADDWKMSSLPLNKDNRAIWVPDLTKKLTYEVEEYIWLEDAEVSSTGVVTGTMKFSVGALCKESYKNFPEDRIRCSFDLVSEEFKKYFYVQQMEYLMYESNLEEYPQNWKVENVNVEINGPLGQVQGEDFNKMKLNLEVSRKSSVLRSSLYIPEIVSGFLFVITPFLGKFKHQHFGKMFALFVQVICYQHMTAQTGITGYGNAGKMPKIYCFYHVTMTVTAIGLVITLFMSLLSKRRWSLPPPYKVYVLSTNITGTEEDIQKVPLYTVGETEKMPQGNKNKEWKSVFTGINFALSIGLAAVYLLGIWVYF